MPSSAAQSRAPRAKLQGVEQPSPEGAPQVWQEHSARQLRAKGW